MLILYSRFYKITIHWLVWLMIHYSLFFTHSFSRICCIIKSDFMQIFLLNEYIIRQQPYTPHSYRVSTNTFQAKTTYKTSNQTNRNGFVIILNSFEKYIFSNKSDPNVLYVMHWALTCTYSTKFDDSTLFLLYCVLWNRSINTFSLTKTK